MPWHAIQPPHNFCYVCRQHFSFYHSFFYVFSSKTTHQLSMYKWQTANFIFLHLFDLCVNVKSFASSFATTSVFHKKWWCCTLSWMALPLASLVCILFELLFLLWPIPTENSCKTRHNLKLLKFTLIPILVNLKRIETYGKAKKQVIIVQKVNPFN